MSSSTTFQQTLDSIKTSLPLQVQPYLTHTNLQSFLRIVVIIATYLLFRPHLESIFRKITGTPDKRQEEIKARLEFLQRQKEKSEAMAMFGGKIPVLNKEGKVLKLVTPEEAEMLKAQGAAVDGPSPRSTNSPGGAGAGAGKGKKGKSKKKA
ncbi:uncharacterized protein PV06_06452 [Exophiala oligosperma]|uniref:Uncharacterized protein n=2 Tax=Chaetothyriales TaxID=34395 RepID=A0A0D2DJ13_9EURO|nr:uncharacterized protein PV06_06452 [Exophiala oligosperma]KAJ9622189.1 hypothetical protein H2204_011621 [Knufia peltigerae]KIW42958.1 hypothetical protein PV06_06452 [Exophiala oligosperma]